PDLRYVTKECLRRHRRSGALILTIPGQRAREVPVLARFADLLEGAAAGAEPGWPLVGGRRLDRRNVTQLLLSGVSGGRDLPPLEIGRLRATWWRLVLTEIGYRAVIAAAGMAVAPPPAVVEHLPAPSVEDLVAVLWRPEVR
ncbi:MAG: hypothetical protein ACRDGL_05935, partial [Candidatus Limnocylindrales bacterium]